MLTTIILNNQEDTVVRMTYQNLFKEIKDIPGAELIIADDWFEAISKVKNTYVCCVEVDCLVNSGYFSSQIGLFKKNPYFRKLAMLSSGIGVNNWANKFYGYSLGNTYADGVVPNMEKKSSSVYPVQIGYFPGSVIRVNMFKELLKDLKPTSDMVQLSTEISLGFWRQGDGNRVHINPNTTYVTTEDNANDISLFDPKATDLISAFKRESIS